MKNILILAGTRPEIIKLAPLFIELKKNKSFLTDLCLTGQHRELAKLASKVFNLKINFNFNVMKHNQDLSLLSASILKKTYFFFKKRKYGAIIVQGDTTSAMIAALAGFYNKIKIFHVEAGLRTFNKDDPFPEETNRKLISQIADYHFSPTKLNRSNLIKEGIKKKNIFITGNTVIDSLNFIKKKFKIKNKSKKQIICTIHRRENQGKKLELFCSNILKISKIYKDWKFIFVTHPNPRVKVIVKRYFNNVDNILMKNSMNYQNFIRHLAESSFVISDSGGIQEECAFLGKYIFIVRDSTERPEIISVNLGRILNIYNKNFTNIIQTSINKKTWLNKKKSLCYGDGNSRLYIANIISELL
jgi:UDP-N-acetylglucosamine 2-epimerase (non-hydrolysing)